MSAQILHDDVRFFQRLLRIDGLYDGDLDGTWGPRTEAGAIEFERLADVIRDQSRAFDVRSEKCIRTLSLKTQPEARLCLDRLLKARFNARIISGTRTYAEQDKLYQQGRFGNPGAVITNAQGGRSNHNFGIAWDIGLFAATGEYIRDALPYADAGAAGKGDKVEWGGDWNTFRDPPHYQLKLRVTVANLRELFEAGTADTAFV